MLIKAITRQPTLPSPTGLPPGSRHSGLPGEAQGASRGGIGGLRGLSALPGVETAEMPEIGNAAHWAGQRPPVVL
jgi:hypothetical protein